MSGQISVTGIAEIDAVLRGMSKQLQHKVLTTAHADAAKPLIITAKATVRKKSGTLAASIGVKKTSLSKVGSIGLIQIGPLQGGTRKGYHGHLIEYGHRIVTRSGRNVGFSRKFPFMEPSFGMTKGIIEGNIAESIAKILLRYMKRTIKKYA